MVLEYTGCRYYIGVDMKFKIGEKVLHRDKIKTIKYFCPCCASGNLVSGSSVYFVGGGFATGNNIKKFPVGTQMEFSFMDED